MLFPKVMIIVVIINFHSDIASRGVYTSLGTRPSKNRKGGSGKSAGVEVYTAPGMQAQFRLAFD